MSAPARTRPAGFTLLEVMVALAVLATALMAISDVTGNAVRNYTYARDLSVATLLARGKMAELEESFEDSGFHDFDESSDGTFADQGRPEFRWKADVKKPDSKLSAEQLLSVFLGGSVDDADTAGLLGKLLGTGSQATGGGPTSALANAAPGGAMGGIMQTQLTAFGEDIKKSMRELRLTVSWKEGTQEHGFDVSTYLVVLNPKAPGGAHGPDPDIPPGLSSASGTTAAAALLQAMPSLGGTPSAASAQQPH
ncbi:MAG TPA: prepilin-type N-terminal cleavage/methylation domain-containing protein [Anaeromyxobacteraceae bacterium]|nr:prepilin-type N-terminal cleavage/methylation domain-containing protein [Anaeromyxobacteraceae bacterium]